METYISNATEKNWLRLKTDGSTRLTKRANKKQSKKKILPIEYFNDCDNMSFIQKVINWFENHDFPIEQVVYSFAVCLLDKKMLLCKPHVQDILREYNYTVIPQIGDFDIPDNEWDILGLIYQSMLFEGKKNLMGSYYTPQKIAKNMTDNFDFSQNQLFLDPCCGSGSFLLAVDCVDPECLYGIDSDPIAVLIAKTNLLIKYSNKIFIPNIFCLDYLSQYTLFGENTDVMFKTFDYIATNPPWGSLTSNEHVPEEITSKERFSCFFVNAYKQLKKNGTIRFLFPESILNVKNHKDIREFLLERCGLEQITLYDTTFSGVVTKYVDVLCKKTTPNSTIIIKKKSDVSKINRSFVRQTDNLLFSFLTDDDLEILSLIKEKGKYSLIDSIWALGIVTGDNKGKLKPVPEKGLEPIYTGKEIQRYLLKSVKNYILYDRDSLQQVARDEFYRAPEKLVYKFISDKLVFAYDNTQSLFLNSANILIPSIPNMSIKTVLAFLNSELFQFVYSKMFGEVKILKGNLLELTFPEISSEQNRRIDFIVSKILDGEIDKDTLLQDEIYSIYDILPKHRLYIRGCVNGRIN